jgi:hypothetical protein
MKDTLTPDSLRPGHLVGPWRVEGYGGRGTYGVVYKARRAGHPGSLPVAIKMALFPDDVRFGREVGILSRFHHPAVPRLIDRGWWHASAEVVHPYLVGVSAHRGPLGGEDWPAPESLDVPVQEEAWVSESRTPLRAGCEGHCDGVAG